ncbi:TVP38/TMEM64 family protein [Bacillus sp. Marseille-P3661]|uniref:TVP38/TMEM64 family protein n=1 Tax=Bacillus sp. Marseille-P3661 TaxID=1936234 RepID=UPI000C826CC2|nr:VTT domain-containing protein [Bacillus sp. Marseille-P3661]
MDILQLLPENQYVAIVISVVINILIAVAGLIPSTFLTAANIIYFGFEYGLYISILGEALGAIISFYLYRKGIKVMENKFAIKENHRFLVRLKNAKGREAILLVLALRILPFVPSGLVTLVAALSRMKAIHFAIASTMGKIPALLIEAYSIYSFFSWNLEYQVGATIFGLGIGLVYYFCNKRKT